MRESIARTRCSCGQVLWMEGRWNGYYCHPVYYPDGEKPDTGFEMQECPACGRKLIQGFPHPFFHSLGAPA